MLTTIRNYIFLGFRGFVYYALYESRFLPYRKIYSLLKGKRPVVNLAIGGVKYKMKLDLNDGGLSHDVFNCKVREYPNVLYFIKYLKKHGKGIDTIVDIGANIGYYVLFANAIYKQKIKQKISTYAFEPVLESYNMLNENVKLNGFDGVETIQAAIGEDDRMITMVIPEHRNLSQVSGVNPGSVVPNAKKRKVDMYSVKTIFSKFNIPMQNVLFRWDIEGYEYNLVKGNLETFRKLKNVHIIMEFHSFFLLEKKTVEFLTMLKDIGFKLEHVVSCYPPYFLKMPAIVRKILIKTWLIEKKGSNLGLLPEFKTIDDLIDEFHNTKSALYTYPNLHFYLSKAN